MIIINFKLFFLIKYNIKMSKNKLLGLITIIISLILSLAAITISGIDFQVLNVKWNQSPWRHLALLQLTSTIYAAVTSIIGIIIFLLFENNKILIPIVILYI